MNYYGETMERLQVGEIIYFTGYGIIEALKIVKITTEETEDAFIGYVDARRPDGTIENIGFNSFGDLAFRYKADAEKALNKTERFTKKDSEGKWYIESKNGALMSDVQGRTYGPAIDRLAFYENNEEKSITQDIFSEKPLMTKITVSGGR